MCKQQHGKGAGGEARTPTPQDGAGTAVTSLLSGTRLPGSYQGKTWVQRKAQALVREAWPREGKRKEQEVSPG